MAEGKILAAVSGTSMTVTDRDVEELLASLGQRAKNYDSPQGRAALLEQLIQQKLLLLDATRNLYEREPEFKAQLARAKEELLFQYAVSKTISSVRVTDAEVKQYYDEHKDELVGEKTVHASHILVSDEAKANDILSQIRAGSISFEDAAKKYSSCPSAQDGGDLGEFGRGQMVPEFDDACFSMEEGEIRGPIRTQFGYHLIRLNGISEASQLRFEEIAGQIKEKLLAEKQQKAYQSKINQLKIQYPVDRY